MDLINSNNLIFLGTCGILLLFVMVAFIYALVIYKRTDKHAKFKHLQRFSLNPITFNLFYWLLTTLMIFCLGIMILRPAYDTEMSPVKLANTDIYLLIDNSLSMGVKDMRYKGVNVTRLDFVKKYLADFVKSNPSSRYSLSSFDHTGNTELPLTNDVNSILSAIDTIAFIPNYYAKGTNMSTGLQQVANHLETNKDSKTPARQKILLIFSDGEITTTDTNLDKISSESNSKLLAQNFSVITVGIGSKTGGKVPYDATATDDKIFYLYYQGKTVVSKLESANLEKEAAATNGKYVQGFEYSGNDELARAVKQLMNSSSITAQGDEKTFKDLYFYCVPPILILLLMLNRLKLNSLKRLS